jgi:hypothetical protein
MNAQLQTLNDRLATIEFALQDLFETGLVASADLALSATDVLRSELETYVHHRKETGDGYRLQSSGLDRQPGEGSTGE